MPAASQEYTFERIETLLRDHTPINNPNREAVDYFIDKANKPEKNRVVRNCNGKDEQRAYLAAIRTIQIIAKEHIKDLLTKRKKTIKQALTDNKMLENHKPRRQKELSAIAKALNALNSLDTEAKKLTEELIKQLFSCDSDLSDSVITDFLVSKVILHQAQELQRASTDSEAISNDESEPHNRPEAEGDDNTEDTLSGEHSENSSDSDQHIPQLQSIISTEDLINYYQSSFEEIASSNLAPDEKVNALKQLIIEIQHINESNPHPDASALTKCIELKIARLNEQDSAADIKEEQENQKKDDALKQKSEDLLERCTFDNEGQITTITPKQDESLDQILEQLNEVMDNEKDKTTLDRETRDNLTIMYFRLSSLIEANNSTDLCEEANSPVFTDSTTTLEQLTLSTLKALISHMSTVTHRGLSTFGGLNGKGQILAAIDQHDTNAADNNATFQKIQEIAANRLKAVSCRDGQTQALYRLLNENLKNYDATSENSQSQLTNILTHCVKDIAKFKKCDKVMEEAFSPALNKKIETLPDAEDTRTHWALAVINSTTLQETTKDTLIKAVAAERANPSNRWVALSRCSLFGTSAADKSQKYRQISVNGLSPTNNNNGE